MVILKVDVDIKMDADLFDKFLRTRVAIIEELGYKLKEIRWHPTRKGYHFWIELEDELSDSEICDLQFLLGDDQVRCKFNYLRLEMGCFKQFNVLFNKKLKYKENEML